MSDTLEKRCMSLVQSGFYPVTIEEISRLFTERNALRRFKEYVHGRLDEAGVPTHPDGPHSAEGCRIGDRLDIALRGFLSALPTASPPSDALGDKQR